MMTYEAYKDFYRKYGKTPYQINSPKNSLNEKQLMSRYHKYCKKVEKDRDKMISNDTIDYYWLEIRSAAFKRDNYTCQLSFFIPDEYKEHLQNLQKAFPQLDPCHIFGKGSYPWMKYDIDNIVILNRVFHSRLDTNRHPFTNELITLIEKEDIWKRIVGNERFESLKKKSQRYKE